MPKRLTMMITVLPVAAMLSVPALAGADLFEVTKRGDHVPGACTNADCTLREAVIEANAQPGDDRVELPSRKPYNLTRELGAGPGEAEEGDLDIDSGLGNLITIAHPGEGRATIDATGAGDRAIELVGAGTLRKLQLRDGDANSTGEAGGALFVDGNATLVRSRIKGSEGSDVGGGIFVTDGTLALRESVVRRNVAGGEGGGIFVDNDATVEVRDSTLARNEADEGGGLFLGSDSAGNSILASTISGNEVTQEGGGLWNGAPTLFVRNSTVADNTADGSGGGLYAAPDSGAALEFVTLTRNRADADDTGPHGGGGVFADGGDDVVSTVGSLFARNRTTGAAFQDCDAPAPVGITSFGDNLVTSEQDCPFFDGVGDIVDDQPLIGVLADNGGPTQTVKLKQGSPAIDEAAGGPNRDQRGVARDAEPDIGAYERA
jgi:CSLREA domain-containing protein